MRLHILGRAQPLSRHLKATETLSIIMVNGTVAVEQIPMKNDNNLDTFGWFQGNLVYPIQKIIFLSRAHETSSELSIIHRFHCMHLFVWQ